MPPPVQTETLTSRLLASRFANAWWPAPALSLALFLFGLTLALVGVHPAPYYVFKLWEVSIALHVAVGISLLVRGKNRDGAISLSLLCLPLICFWLVS